MKHLKLYEEFSEFNEIEIFPDDNSGSSIKISIGEYEKLVKMGYVDNYDNTYNSDKYYDMMSMLGKVRENHEYKEEDDYYDEEDEEDVKYHVEPTYYQVRKHIDNKDYKFEVMADDYVTLDEAREEKMYLEDEYPSDEFYIVKVKEIIVK
jgi:hypothetical protein